MTSDQPPTPIGFMPPEPIPQGPKPVVPPVPPVEPPLPVAPAESAVPIPPPVAHAYYAPAPPPDAARRKRTRTIVIVSVVGGVLILAGIIVALAALIFSFVSNALPPVIDSPVSGAPAEPVAAVPLDCPDACFYVGASAGVIPTADQFAALGVPKQVRRWGDFPLATVADEFQGSVSAWTEANASPDTCFFLYATAPVALGIDDVPGPSDDIIDFLGNHTDTRNVSSLTQTARYFATSAEAEAHLATLRDDIDGCPLYTVEVNGAHFSSRVTPEPALKLPSSVAAAGWVEDAGDGRYYVFDLQRANMVVRNVLFTDGRITEAEFRQFTEQIASKLGGLDVSVSAPFVAPTGCKATCFGVDNALALTPTVDQLAALGRFTADDSNAALTPRPIGPYWDYASATYATGGGDPLACFFTLSDAPISPTSPDYDDRDDNAVPLGTFIGLGQTLTETARVYQAELYAGRYIASLKSPVRQCSTFAYKTGDFTTTSKITPLAIDTGQVASIGWVETVGSDTRSVVDLQWRNLTIRVALKRTFGDLATDEQFADYVKSVAQTMQAMG